MVTASPARPRVDVLAYPAATTTRFLLVVVSLLTAGLFVGTWTHNTTAVGRTWVLIQAECAQQALRAADEADDFDERFRKLWRFYLSYCEAGFRTERTDVVQLSLAKA